MKKQLRSIAFMMGIAFASLCLSPALLHAQQVNEDQRAYDTGYQNGVNAARRNQPMNMNTDDWHGNRLNEYQRGYKEGYESLAGHHDYDHDRGYVNAPQYQDQESRRAYQTGYQNGVHDAQRNRALNPRTDDWHGNRLQAYQQGYEQGYHSVAGRHHDHDDDDR